MTVYFGDNPRFFSEAIQSVIEQTRLPDEFLIVQDGPISNELKNVLDLYMMRFPFIHTIKTDKNLGAGLASRLGIENCHCDLVARLDADDLCYNKRFEIEHDFLLTHPNIRFVGSNTIEFVDSIENKISARIMPETNEEIQNFARKRNPFITSSVMFYRNDIVQIGNYQNWYLCEDYELWSRVIQANIQCYNIQKNLSFMRTSKDFYKRRGGIKYCRSILKLKSHFRKIGFMSFPQFFKSSAATAFVSLAPNFIRKFIYTQFLRD